MTIRDSEQEELKFVTIITHRGLPPRDHLYGYTVQVLGRLVCEQFAAFATRTEARAAAIDDLLETLDRLTNFDPDSEDAEV